MSVTQRKVGMALDTSYRQRRLANRLENDPEFRAAYDASVKEIAQVDAVMRELDELRIAAGKSKAALARDISKNPASVRRLFTSHANPELRTVAAIANALDAEIVVKSRKRQKATKTSKLAAQSASQVLDPSSP
jgi:DNA-binding phage protein